MARKVSNIHYIYKITCNVTKRWYVGMHSTSNEDDGYMGSGTILRRSIRKYGVENHTKEILSYHLTREELVLREIEIVNKELISDGFCMNLKEGGNGGFTSEQQSKNAFKSIEKQNILRETDADWVKKVKENQSEAQKDKYKKGRLKVIPDWNGRNHSEETKELISQRMKEKGTGEANSQYGTCWITKDGINKKVTKDELNDHLYDGWITGRK